MGKYIGPKVKIIRRLGILPGLTQKLIKEKKRTPGEHGKHRYKKKINIQLSDESKVRRIEKQKLRFNYGILEKQLVSYYKEAKRQRGSTDLLLLKRLESRLDCILYRGGFAPTIPAAKQVINHGHILVNDKKVTVGSFLCTAGDCIEIRNNKRSQSLININLRQQLLNRKYIFEKTKRFGILYKFLNVLIPKHLKLDKKKMSLTILSMIKRKDILLKINELKVVEYYSR